MVYKSKSNSFLGDERENVPDGVALPAAGSLFRRPLRVRLGHRAHLLGHEEGAGAVRRGRRGACLPDVYSQIFRLYVYSPFGVLDYGSATLRCKI